MLGRCLPLPRRQRIIRFFRGVPDESFRALVQQHAFNQIQCRLESGPSYSQKKVRWLYKDMYQQGPLHFVLPYRPPLSLVESVLLCTGDFSHVPEEALDAEGRTPLHIAAAYNCSFQIIRRLLSGVSLVVPALTRDDMDRFPLHWACCHPFMAGRVESENKFDTIILLLDAYPQAVDMVDANGHTPLDYALQHPGLDRRITDLLEKVAARQREQRNRIPKKKEKYRSSSPRAVTDLNHQASSPVGPGVPSEIDALASTQLRGTRQRDRGNANSFCDDISSLGWDRVSLVANNGHSPRNRPSVTGTTGSLTSPRNTSSATDCHSRDVQQDRRLAFPFRAKSLVQGYMRRFSPNRKRSEHSMEGPHD